jgi:hypothetical protein
MRSASLRRTCALCDTKLFRNRDRLCARHMEEFKDRLTEPWLRGIIEETNYEYNVARRDVRNHVESLERLLGKV